MLVFLNKNHHSMIEFSSKTCPNPYVASSLQDTCPVAETRSAAAQNDSKTTEITRILFHAMVLSGVFLFAIPPILSIGVRSIESALIA